MYSLGGEIISSISMQQNIHVTDCLQVFKESSYIFDGLHLQGKSELHFQRDKCFNEYISNSDWLIYIETSTVTLR